MKTTITCGLCNQVLPEPPEMDLERHILTHRQGQSGKSPALEAALAKQDMDAVIAAVRAEERLRMQKFIRWAETVALAGGRVEPKIDRRGDGPTFWFDV